MKNIDSEELLELKRLRQNKLKKDRPPKSVDDIFNKTPTENLLLDDDNEDLQQKQNIDNTNYDDDDSFIRFGKFKLKGIWEITVSIFTMVVFVVVAWVRFETSLRNNTENIEQIKAEQVELRTHVNTIVPALQQNIESRLSHVERKVLILENQAGSLEYRIDSHIMALRSEVEKLKSDISTHNSDITQIMRQLNRIESQLGL